MRKKKSTFSVFDFLQAIGFTVLIFVLTFGCCFTAYRIISLPCGNDVIDEIYSPDHQFKVVVFFSDCGATTKLHTNASILKANQRISNSTLGNIFIPDDTDVQIIWKNDQTIQITYLSDTTALSQKIELQYSGKAFEIYYQAKPK